MLVCALEDVSHEVALIATLLIVIVTYHMPHNKVSGTAKHLALNTIHGGLQLTKDGFTLVSRSKKLGV